MAAGRIAEKEGGGKKTFPEQEELSVGNIMVLNIPTIPSIYIYFILYEGKERKKSF